MKASQNKGKIKHRHTNQTEQASENNSQYNSISFSIPSGNKKLAFPQFNDVPNTHSKNHKLANFIENKQFSPFSLLAPSNDSNPKLDSMSDASQITLSKDIKDTRTVNVNQDLKEMLHQKSANQLTPTGLKPPNLSKSQTEPYLFDTNHYDGFQIRTTIVNDSADFKKSKAIKEPNLNHNKTMSYLQINQPPKLATNKTLAASRIINDTRITLKDYLFMAKISSRKAAEQKRYQLKVSKKGIKTQQSESSQNISSVSRKSRYQKQKYHINNDEMARVLKLEIGEEMSTLQRKMEKIKEWMKHHEQASADELLLLYDMRRDIKTYNNKFEESIQKLYSGDHKQFVQAIHDISIVDIDQQFEDKQIGPNQSQILQLQQI